MVRMLSLTENLHTILRVLYDDMMALCYPMSQVAMAIPGIGVIIFFIISGKPAAYLFSIF